jgi:hypothetical protein
LRYNEAATLDPSPLLISAAVRAAVSPPVGGPARYGAKVEEKRQHFSENKARAVSLLQNAIRTLEEEIAKAGPEVEEAGKAKQTPDVAAETKLAPKFPAKTDVRSVAPRRWSWITFEAVRGRVGQWLRRKG